VAAATYRWIDRNVLELGREMRLSYLPPLMVYMAAGISGLTGIVGTFFIKDTSGSPPSSSPHWASGRVSPGRSRFIGILNAPFRRQARYCWASESSKIRVLGLESGTFRAVYRPETPNPRNLAPRADASRFWTETSRD